jgi:hypothetical protein
MSIEAISWALNLAPIPTDRRDASSLAIVLVGLANHADPDGRNAFPAVATLVRYTRLSERSVRYALHALEELGLITPADPDIVAAYIRRRDRRPNGWDLTLTARPAPAPATTNGTVAHNLVHNRDVGVQPVHPVQAHGVQTQPNGVQTTTSRGAATAPEPSKNHPRNRPARALAAPPAHQHPPCRPCAAGAMPDPVTLPAPASSGSTPTTRLDTRTGAPTRRRRLGPSDS